jgi:hypothetical protein
MDKYEKGILYSVVKDDFNTSRAPIPKALRIPAQSEDHN